MACEDGWRLSGTSAFVAETLMPSLTFQFARPQMLLQSHVMWYSQFLMATHAKVPEYCPRKNKLHWTKSFSSIVLNLKTTHITPTTDRFFLKEHAMSIHHTHRACVSPPPLLGVISDQSGVRDGGVLCQAPLLARCQWPTRPTGPVLAMQPWFVIGQSGCNTGTFVLEAKRVKTGADLLCQMAGDKIRTGNSKKRKRKENKTK